MALITRFSRLFSADLHAVLDRLEEPEILLKQAVRDMEEELARMRADVLGARTELQRIAQQQTRLDGRLTDLESELDVCFAAGEETLARSLVRRKLETERLRQTLTNRRDALVERLAELEPTIAANDRHLSAMREKVEVLGERHETPCSAVPGCDDIAVGSDEVEVAFLREQQRRVRS